MQVDARVAASARRLDHHLQPLLPLKFVDAQPIREPYPFGPRHQAELETVAPCVLVDGKDLFWWGTRTTGALERLAALLDTLP